MSAYLQQQVHDLKIRVRKLEQNNELEEIRKSKEYSKMSQKERLSILKSYADEIRKLEEGP